MYYKLPMALLKDSKYRQLSGNAKLLYAWLLGRSEMSFKNGWVDSENKPYIYCTREEMTEVLNVSERTAVRLFSELLDAGLVSVNKQGTTKSKRIYVENLLSKNHVYKTEQQTDHRIEVPFINGDKTSRALLEQFLQL